MVLSFRLWVCIWISGPWIDVWALCVSWCMLFSCVSPSLLNSMSSSLSICPLVSDTTLLDHYPLLVSSMRTCHSLSEEIWPVLYESFLLDPVNPPFFPLPMEHLVSGFGQWKEEMRGAHVHGGSVHRCKLLRQYQEMDKDDYCLVWCESKKVWTFYMNIINWIVIDILRILCLCVLITFILLAAKLAKKRSNWRP